MAQGIDTFFDAHAADYYGKSPGPMRPFHRRIAATLQNELSGDVLCIGGLWSAADLNACHCRLTIGDVSEGMLAHWKANGVRSLICDARDLPFKRESFDHLVLPLVLHHIAGGHGMQARRNVRRAFKEAYRVLRPGGRLWISEFCLPAPVYSAELLASPLTARALGLLGVPLVVMHSAGFYRSAVRAAGFSDVGDARVRAPEARPLDLLRPVIGVPWLLLPRIAYPVRPTLIQASR